jgi:molybdopterin-containing oxidoreductase family membrane subunit
MWFLLFIRQLPVMAISEVKEIVPPKYRVPEDHSHDLDALVIDPEQTMGDD